MTNPRLNINNLCVDYPESRAVNNASFTLGNERPAPVGESGPGKSITARTLMGLVRKPGVVAVDTLNILRRDALTLNARGRQQLRGNDITMVLQGPRHTLNSVKTVKVQLGEVLTLHRCLSRREKKEKINTTTQVVGLSMRVLQSCPRRFSGGMEQRMMIVVTLVNDPRVLITDEPTSVLDVRLRDQIPELLVIQREQCQMAMLLISRDLPLVTQFYHRMLVIYQGNKVDEMHAAALPTAAHPYTRTLWTCRPSTQTYGQMLPMLDRTTMTPRRYHDDC